jgi:Ankyrin repeats (many copies)
MSKLLRSRGVWVVLGIAVGFFFGAAWMAYRDMAYDRAVWRGSISELREANQLESGVNRFVYKPSFENVLRKVLGFGLIGKEHPMVLAATSGGKAMAAELIRIGVDVNGHDGTGYRALTYAAHKGDVALCRFLLDHGADPNLRWKDGTPIHDEATPEVLRLFKERGIVLIP